MERLIGARLGKFELRAEIGRGGMGAVFEGYDPQLDRRVAVKVLAPHLVWETEFVERFFREARAAARLDHPAIVTMHDVGQEQGWYYIVMKYLEGQPLTQLLLGGKRLSLPEAHAILRPLAEALDYAHSRGLVHRDVKPANVIVGPTGQVTLTDFGIARAAEGAHLTRSGVVIGTPEYMAPEQAQGQPVDARSDQYALGVMAYEMLCGRVPFETESTPVLLHKVVYERPAAPRQVCPSLPEVAARALERALEKEPGKRFANCTEFVQALTAAVVTPAEARRAAPAPGGPTNKPEAAATQAQAASAAPPASRERKGRAGWVAGLAGLAMIAGGIALNAAMGGGGGRETPAPPTDCATAAPSEATDAPTATAVAPATDTPGQPATAEGAASAPPTGAALGDTWLRPVDGMVMVYVPAGEFEMGSTEGASDEQPVHTVALDGYWIDRTEVTVAQFAVFVQRTGHRTTAVEQGWGYAYVESAGGWREVEGADWQHPQGPASNAIDDQPAVQVSWDDAAAYCAWAGGRLPTEAQWEYAARGPEGRVYPWGDSFDCLRGNFDDETLVDDYVVPGGAGCDGYEKAAPVGSFPESASWCGALDMAGNVWKWADDWYSDYASGRQVNPEGPSSGEYRVMRGGSWNNGPDIVRSATRYWLVPGYTLDYLGFRCVVVAPGR